MKFIKLDLPGAYIIEQTYLNDDRGFFSRSFCQDEFNQYKLNVNVEQCNISFNLKKGTVRGLHYQKEPYSEAKLVRCTSGRIYDVIVDLRKKSTTYMQWRSFELTAQNRNMLYIPEGFAHGFQTLEDNVEVFYQMFTKFSSDAASGIRWNDPAFTIQWPLKISTISDKDISYQDFIK